MTIQIKPSDGAAVQAFGYSISVSGDTVAVGACPDEFSGDPTGGSIYILENETEIRLGTLGGVGPGVKSEIGSSETVRDLLRLPTLWIHLKEDGRMTGQVRCLPSLSLE